MENKELAKIVRRMKKDSEERYDEWKDSEKERNICKAYKTVEKCACCGDFLHCEKRKETEEREYHYRQARKKLGEAMAVFAKEIVKALEI